MIISVALKRFLTQSNTTFDKIPEETRNRRDISQCNKASIMLTRNTQSISIKVKQKIKYPLSPLFFTMAFAILARVIRQDKKIKGIQIGKEDTNMCMW